jgi:hypothetical protein
MDGSGLQRCLNDGCVVKNKSSVFSFLHAKARKTKKKKDKDRYKRLQTEVQYEIRKAGKKYTAADLSINAGTSSGPVALCGFWFFNSL